MGGVETDTDGLTEMTGLYAAGEVACVPVHGANRLGGNSLMETIVRPAAPAAPPPVGARRHDRHRARVGDARRRARAEGAPLAHEGRAALADPRRARTDDAEELRRFPPRGADGGADRDHRQPARALPDGRRRGQGRGLQLRPDAGDRARLPARRRRLHAPGRDRPARRAAVHSRPTTTRPGTTRTSSSALDLALARQRPRADVQGSPDDQVDAEERKY